MLIATGLLAATGLAGPVPRGSGKILRRWPFSVKRNSMSMRGVESRKIPSGGALADSLAAKRMRAASRRPRIKGLLPPALDFHAAGGLIWSIATLVAASKHIGASGRARLVCRGRRVCRLNRLSLVGELPCVGNSSSVRDFFGRGSFARSAWSGSGTRNPGNPFGAGGGGNQPPAACAGESLWWRGSTTAQACRGRGEGRSGSGRRCHRSGQPAETGGRNGGEKGAVSKAIVKGRQAG